MNYDEITKITAERISDYMTEAVNTDSIAVAEMFHNAAWGVRTLWFELVTKIDIDIHKKNRYASYDLRRKIEMQHEEFQKMTEREQVPFYWNRQNDVQRLRPGIFFRHFYALQDIV